MSRKRIYKDVTPFGVPQDMTQAELDNAERVGLVRKVQQTKCCGSAVYEFTHSGRVLLQQQPKSDVWDST